MKWFGLITTINALISKTNEYETTEKELGLQPC